MPSACLNLKQNKTKQKIHIYLIIINLNEYIIIIIIIIKIVLKAFLFHITKYKSNDCMRFFSLSLSLNNIKLLSSK